MAKTVDALDTEQLIKEQARHVHRRASRQALRRAGIFLIPFGVLFLFVYLFSVGYSIYNSLFTMERSGSLGLSTEKVFSGFSNYIRAFTDSDFLHALGRVFMIGIIQVPVMLILALVLALLIDMNGVIAPKFFRLIYFLPYALPGVIAGIMWAFLYKPDLSPIVKGLAAIGININFLSDNVLPWAIINIMTWSWTGYNMIIIYSSLTSIDQSIIEAAAMDGASRWKTAWHIKVPIVRPAIIMTAVFSIIGTAQLYNEPLTMKAVTPSLSKDYTPLMKAANDAFSATTAPYAAAQAVIIALLIGGASALFFRLTREKDPK
jgi:multiple sugar transport system permease protein